MGPPAGIPAALVAVRSLIGLLRDDRLDPAFAQVGAARPREVRLIGSYRLRSSARAADRSAHPDFLRHRDEPGAIGGLSGREHERQRATAPTTGGICPVSVAPFPAPRPLPAPPRPPVPPPSPGRVVMGAGHRGVHANQRHLRLAAPSSLGDHPLHQRGEHADVAPLGEAVVDRLPGPELLGYLPSRHWLPVRNRQMTPSNCSRRCCAVRLRAGTCQTSSRSSAVAPLQPGTSPASPRARDVRPQATPVPWRQQSTVVRQTFATRSRIRQLPRSSRRRIWTCARIRGGLPVPA
jgi:hypothetical protein